MWVFRNNAFVSIVQDRTNSRLVWVRARYKGDVENFLNGASGTVEVVETAANSPADYAYRVLVSKADVAEALLDALEAVKYDNFKGSIPKSKEGDLRHDAYMDVWTALRRWQQKTFRPSAKKAKGRG